MAPRAQSYSRAALLLATIVATDQIAKRLVVTGIPRGESRSVFFGIKLVRVDNKGVAFGAFSGKPVVLIIVAVALVGLVVWFFLHARRPLVWLPTGLLLGGALGNIIDRVRDGAVTDFIKLPFWPAFNIADVSITVGVLALLIVLEQRDAPERPA